MNREAVRNKIKELFEPLEHVSKVYATCLTGDEDFVEVWTIMNCEDWGKKRDAVYDCEFDLMEAFPDYLFDFHVTTSDVFFPENRVVFEKK